MKALFLATKAALAGGIARKVAIGVLAVSAAGTAGIIAHEGVVRQVYLDPVNIPTVCVGHTGTVTSADVVKRFTQEQCDALLRQDLRDAERAVKAHVRVPVTQGQYDALVSFTFNVGSANLAKSTLVRKLNSGDCWGAAAEFDKWVYARNQKLPGLVKRRADERAAFSTGC
ncbi:MAG: lysozyme [bacterium]